MPPGHHGPERQEAAGACLATVSAKPLYKIKRLLSSLNRVTNATVLRGRQRTLWEFVTTRVKEASITRDIAGDEGATPKPTLDSTVATANLRRQPPCWWYEHDSRTSLQRRRQRRPPVPLEEHWTHERRARLAMLTKLPSKQSVTARPQRRTAGSKLTWQPSVCAPYRSR